MPSRLQSIRTLVETHISTAISGVTISNDLVGFETVPKDQFPHARVIFTEATPERLSFKQERRNVNGLVVLGFLMEGTTEAAAREACDVKLEAIRDAIFADHTLSASVDSVVVEGAQTFSQADDSIIYGTLDIATEEIF